MNILIWATTLQADILSLAFYIDSSDANLTIVTENPENFRKEPVFRFKPLKAPILDMKHPDIERTVASFKPDVVVADNHMPVFLKKIKFCTMWHGLGWKARGKSDINQFYKNIESITGNNPRKPSKNFMAQCYGIPDRDWRIEQWKLHPGSCKITGMAFSDLLLNPPYTKKDLQQYYSIDILNKKVVLLSVSWHYGRIISENQNKGLLSWKNGIATDMEFLDTVLGTIHSKGANCIFCLHDRKRYEPQYLEAIQDIVRMYPNVMVKHKSDHPDNLSDLIVSDIMVSNLSSFITYFYFRGLPSVHIIPSDRSNEKLRLAQIKRGRVSYRTLSGNEQIYMNDPEDNGGITAWNLQGVADGIIHGLENPDCCREKSRSWIDRHIYKPDGSSAMRFFEVLQEFGGGN
ncbi:MAG TPA: hypothetical protein PKG52_08550 [bacterium]|nr:hypothetical protein [bacterium]HPS30802.1 hypothetical protein [bacterium]